MWLVGCSVRQHVPPPLGSCKTAFATMSSVAGTPLRVVQVVQLTALLAMSLTIGRSWAQYLGTVYTTAQDYTVEHQNGNIQGLYCDLPDNHNPYACESDYWLAYSQLLNNPPMSMALCGQCLQLVNNDGGASVKACILDLKVADGFDLDLPGFAALDTDGQGAFYGHLYVTAEFVPC